MKNQLCLLLASSALVFTLGCGSESSVPFGNPTSQTTFQTTATESAVELPASGGAAPILGIFSLQLTGKTALDSSVGGISDVAGFTPSAAGASRLVASFVDHPDGLLDRRLNVEVGRNGGPLLASGIVYPIGQGMLRVVYLERTSAVRAEIFEGTAGSLSLLEIAPGPGKTGRAAFRLDAIRLVSRTGLTTDLSGTATLDF